MNICRLTPLVLAALLLIPAAVWAHGVDTARVTAGAAETVRFTYTTGEPMMYAQIRLYPPSSPETDVYQSLADRNGLFSFTPDEAGAWRVTAEDGMGHKGEITVEAAGAVGEAAGGGAAGVSAGGAKPPKPVAALLGLSLLANGFALWFTLRRKGAANAH
ncbi:MAG: hypothetical protein LBD20_06750 [Spirochaetaceae bacterium]|nr:hypothetical protein [Spirochaetaceae bacterium]